MEDEKSWEYKEDMLNEKNIVPEEDLLSEESEVLENGEESIRHSNGTKD